MDRSTGKGLILLASTQIFAGNYPGMMTGWTQAKDLEDPSETVQSNCSVQKSRRAKGLNFQASMQASTPHSQVVQCAGGGQANKVLELPSRHARAHSQSVDRTGTLQACEGKLQHLLKPTVGVSYSMDRRGLQGLLHFLASQFWLVGLYMALSLPLYARKSRVAQAPYSTDVFVFWPNGLLVMLLLIRVESVGMGSRRTLLSASFPSISCQVVGPRFTLTVLVAFSWECCYRQLLPGTCLSIGLKKVECVDLCACYVWIDMIEHAFAHL